MTQMQMRRQAGWWNPILSALLRPATLVLLAMTLSLFSIIYIGKQHSPSEGPIRGAVEDHPLVRGNNPMKKVARIDNGMVNINAKLSTMNPLDVWETLIKTSSIDRQKKKQTVIEVGVHTPKQCIDAAELGYDTHCFEPSPPSYNRSEQKINNISSSARDRIHIYNKAVGATSGQTIPFHSTGGTGDHVGDYDMWNMKRQFVSQSAQDQKKRGTIVQVPTLRLDDFIAGDDIDGNDVYLLKVDTQGFEPSIFLGLEKTFQDASVNYIIFEFWPRGMDLLSDTSNECTGHKILDQLIAAGYTLYALKVESHPKAPLTGHSLHAEAETRPYVVQSTKEYCKWFFELEKKYPSKAGEEEYKFGYWSDFLAVAPGVELPREMR